MSIIHFTTGVINQTVGAVAGVSLFDRNINSTRSTITPGTATSRLLILTDGSAQQQINANAGTDTLGAPFDYNATDWWTSKPTVDIGDDYEVRLTVDSTNSNGTFGGDSQGVWLAITSDRQWQLTFTGDNTNDVATRSCTLEIRDSATMTLQDSATINFQCSLFN